MKNFTLIAALILCSFSWISVSGSQTVEVQSGKEVTMLCSNFSSSPTQIIWFRVVKRSQPHCIAHMFTALEHTLCDGFKSGEYEMSSNVATVFLKIKHVNSSDSGLYFCGFNLNKNPVIHETTYLEVQDLKQPEVRCTESNPVSTVILGAVTGFLVNVIIVLAVKVRKLRTAASEERNPQQRENLDSDELKDAAQSLYSTIRYRRTASERDVETHDVYAASR